MIRIRSSGPADAERTIEIWRRAVDATHDFLDPRDRRAIEAQVTAFLPSAPLLLAVDEGDRAIGFMLIEGGHMEALFVDPAHRGAGVGRGLVSRALQMRPGLTTDVNAQNAQAVGFYRRLGFAPVGWSATDGQGRPYPLIHLRHGGGAPG